ncbi:hypothetical protein HV824_01210 [Myxococcus sp. AM009]|uniref:hypothetical protein n=1 Tax=unclassified Myxococcus TaxID=2648731 RepID=UPI0015953A4D|nr:MULTISPECIES: hypothetical protein [unclassified Myxococcus]NVI96744.1 hypothetical protein [Myxococcus sp. AM009]NVJ14706.1 hypothetical protein [Myxococcus sp. AM010]
MRRLVLTAALLALATGCTKDDTQSADGIIEPIPNPHQPGDFTPLPDPEAQDGSVGRAPRRLTVAQLDAAIIEAVGQRWSELDSRATSMGRADYALVVSENTEPNLVFAKFLEDGARKVCLNQASAELRMTDASARTMGRLLPEKWDDLTKLTDAEVRAQLVYMSTRFWGAPLAGEELTKWTSFFTQAAARVQTLASSKRHETLAVVCIAMLTDPRFITY